MSGQYVEYSDEELEQLKLLHREGWSCSQIARKLNEQFHNGRTRNSVIGKVHRLGLGGRVTPSRQVQDKRKVRRRPLPPPSKPLPVPATKAEPKKATERPLSAKKKKVAHTQPKASETRHTATKTPAKPIQDPADRNIDIMDLKNHHCRWPLGEGPPFVFCGLRKAEGSSYCAGHKALSEPKDMETKKRAHRVSTKVAYS